MSDSSLLYRPLTLHFDVKQVAGQFNALCSRRMTGWLTGRMSEPTTGSPQPDSKVETKYVLLFNRVLTELVGTSVPYRILFIARRKVCGCGRTRAISHTYCRPNIAEPAEMQSFLHDPAPARRLRSEQAKPDSRSVQSQSEFLGDSRDTSHMLNGARHQACRNMVGRMTLTSLRRMNRYATRPSVCVNAQWARW